MIGHNNVAPSPRTSVGHAALRLKEAAKLGFAAAFVPPGTKGVGGLKAVNFATLGALVDYLGAKSGRASGRQA